MSILSNKLEFGLAIATYQFNIKNSMKATSFFFFFFFFFLISMKATSSSSTILILSLYDLLLFVIDLSFKIPFF
jgi:hypothetical protein